MAENGRSGRDVTKDAFKYATPVGQNCRSGLNNTDKYNENPLREILLVAGWLYLLFVVYGSLVPLDFHPMSLAEAGQAFLRIPYLEIDLASRAD